LRGCGKLGINMMQEPLKADHAHLRVVEGLSSGQRRGKSAVDGCQLVSDDPTEI
jgi:hypothetical protein